MFLSFPPPTQMFQFSGFPTITYGFSYGQLRFAQLGFPIQKSPDHWIFAPSRSLSQLITSFIGSQCQGIHLVLLILNLISQSFAQRCKLFLFMVLVFSSHEYLSFLTFLLLIHLSIHLQFFVSLQLPFLIIITSMFSLKYLSVFGFQGTISDCFLNSHIRRKLFFFLYHS